MPERAKGATGCSVDAEVAESATGRYLEVEVAKVVIGMLCRCRGD